MHSPRCKLRSKRMLARSASRQKPSDKESQIVMPGAGTAGSGVADYLSLHTAWRHTPARTGLEPLIVGRQL
jgi:hypothetical protein